MDNITNLNKLIYAGVNSIRNKIDIPQRILN